MLEKVVTAYTKFFIRFYIPIAILLIALTWFCFPKVIAIFKNIQTDFASLLPDNYASVQRFNEVTDLFGSLKNLTLVIETKNSEKLKTAIPNFANYLETDESVDKVEWRKPGYDFFNKHKLFFPSVEDLVDLRDRIDRRIQREKLGGLYISFEDEGEDEKTTFDDLKEKYASTYSGKITSEFYTNDDETVFLVNLNPKGEKLDVAYYKDFAAKIKDRIAKYNLEQYDPTAKIHYTGGVITSAHEYDSLIRDLRLAGIVSGTLMLLLVILYFRHLRAVLFVFLPLGCGLIWNFAIAYYAIGHLNMTTAFLFSIISGLGIDFGILLNSRYSEERVAGRDLAGAIYAMLLYTGRSSFTACFTTAAAFLVLIINDFKGFTEFGFIAGTGVIVILAAYFLILPVMRTIEEKLPFLRRKTYMVTDLRLACLTKLPRRKMLYGMAGVLVLAVISASILLRFDFNFANIRAPNAALEKAQELEHFVNPQKAIPSVVLVHNKEDAQTAKKAIEGVRDANPKTLIDSARNVYSLVPEKQKEKIPTMREIKKLLDDETIEKLVKGGDKEKIDGLKGSAEANPFTIEDVPGAIKDYFVDKKTGEQNQLVFIFLKSEVDLKDGKLAMALAKDIRDIRSDTGKTYHAVSSSVLFADVLTVMLADSPKAIALSLLAIAILLLIDFRNIKYSLVSMIPLIAGVCIMLGIMGISRLQLNFFNMIVLPVMLGIGIDCGVHIFHRFQEEGYTNLPKVMTTTGSSIVMTTLTTAAGFSGMVLAHHGGLSSIGLAAIVGLLSILAVNLLFFPSILSSIWKKG
ncbi:MAG: MMPL family transporter [Pseudomonadota bacterium]